MTTLAVHPVPSWKLPYGFTVRLGQGVRVSHGGCLLVGGSPLTAVRLSAPAAARFRGCRLTVTDAAAARLADRLIATNLAIPLPESCAPVAPEDLTVVVPIRDRADQLGRLLRALQPLQCVVVDDASHDRLAVRSAARRHGATVVHLPVNRGPAVARNTGLSRVRTPYVAFVDSDVEVTPEQLLGLARHLADPQVALVGPRIVGVSRSERPRWFEKYDEQRSSLTLGERPGLVRPGADVGWLPSACLVGRTAALSDGFTPALRVGEDVDLVWRLCAQGKRVRYEPAIGVAHDTRGTVRSWMGRKVLYGSGGAELARRHGDLLAPAVLNPVLALAAATVLMRSRWAPVVVPAAVASVSLRLGKALPASPDRTALGATLAVQALGWSVRQESALLLRHWWPATLAALPSRRARRALTTALIVDALVARHDRPDDDPLPMPQVLLARRLDDLAYGAGLWLGALRARSLRVLAPRRPRSR